MRDTLIKGGKLHSSLSSLLKLRERITIKIRFTQSVIDKTFQDTPKQNDRHWTRWQRSDEERCCKSHGKWQFLAGPCSVRRHVAAFNLNIKRFDSNRRLAGQPEYVTSYAQCRGEKVESQQEQERQEVSFQRPENADYGHPREFEGQVEEIGLRIEAKHDESCRIRISLQEA